jgi:hypothetical protein
MNRAWTVKVLTLSYLYIQTDMEVAYSKHEIPDKIHDCVIEVKSTASSASSRPTLGIAVYYYY